MSVIVGWLVSANCADTLTVDKFVIGEEFLRPWNRKITTDWLPKKTLQRPLSLWGHRPHRPPPHGSATARNRGNVQVIVRKDHRMRLSFLRVVSNSSAAQSNFCPHGHKKEFFKALNTGTKVK